MPFPFNASIDELIALRDQAFIEKCLPLFNKVFTDYHTVETTGFENLPEGAALLVGNHNGGNSSPDMFALMAAYWSAYGPDAQAYGLAHDVPFLVPGLRQALQKFGAVPARHHFAEALLARGAKVLVYPGGDIDAFRSSSKKREIVFGNRTGFIRLALKSRVPIVPVVAAGAHDGFHVLTDGRSLVQKLGLKKFTRIEVLPLILSFPFGFTIGPVQAYLPWPLRIQIRILSPISFLHYPPEAADDAQVVETCKKQVHQAMQEELNRLYDNYDVGRKRLVFLNG